MAKIPIKFAEMHSSLFLMGKSFGGKLDPTKVQGLSMAFDPDTDKFYITYKEETATVPVTSVMYWIEGEPKVRESTGQVTTTAPHTLPRQSAQVSGPVHHVHAGPGAGKTGKG